MEFVTFGVDRFERSLVSVTVADNSINREIATQRPAALETATAFGHWGICQVFGAPGYWTN